MRIDFKEVLEHMMFEDAEQFNEEYDPEEDAQHYGVLGMKWGVRKDPQKAYERGYQKLNKLDRKVTASERRVVKAQEKSVKAQEKAASAILFKKHKARKAANKIRAANREHLRTQRKVAKAERWYKTMENTFRDKDVKKLDQGYIDLGKKYANVQVDDLMSNATTAASMMQLMSYYENRGRKN